MGLVDDHEVVVAPVDVSEVDVAGSAAVAGEVGVVENVVVEAVGGEEVAAVVGLVERPVVAEPLGHQHQHAVVAQLVVFDDGQGLEGLAEADAVGDDAAAQALQLVDGADDAVPLELVELLPDGGVADAGGGLDDALFVQFVPACLEELKQYLVVNERSSMVIAHRLGDAPAVVHFAFWSSGHGIPEGFIPGGENSATSSGASAHWISPNWLPGARPRPSVVRGQLPVMTRL